MSITVLIPTSLKDWFDGRDETTGSGRTVRACFMDINTRYPGFLDRILDSSGDISNVLVFVNGENIRNLDGIETPVKNSDEIGIIPLAAGG
ncbi:MAG: MoaD/ThiS family protein [Pirellulales bacterium]|nr:MoaD/ThiS family protein [Pirellulales bacterium]